MTIFKAMNTKKSQTNTIVELSNKKGKVSVDQINNNNNNCDH